MIEFGVWDWPEAACEISSLVPRPLPAFNIEKLGVAWGRGYEISTLIHGVRHAALSILVYLWPALWSCGKSHGNC